VALAALRASQGHSGDIVPLLLPLLDGAAAQQSPDLARARALLNKHAGDAVQPAA
jgi:hypothetical protein